MTPQNKEEDENEKGFFSEHKKWKTIRFAIYALATFAASFYMGIAQLRPDNKSEKKEQSIVELNLAITAVNEAISDLVEEQVRASAIAKESAERTRELKKMMLDFVREYERDKLKKEDGMDERQREILDAILALERKKNYRR